MKSSLKLLLLEDNEADAERLQDALREGGLEFSAHRVQTRDDFQQALRDLRPGAVLAERRLPGFDGLAVLELTRKVLLRTPVIFVTAMAADEAAVELLRDGAADHVSKDKLQALVPALQRAMAAADDARARAHAERALKMSELQCRRLFETARDGIAILDSVSGTIVEVNRLLVELIGCRREELAGRKISEVGSFKAVAVVAVVFRQLQHTDHVHYEHLTLQKKSGETVDIEVLGSAYHLGSARYVQCTMRDITARIHAEQEALRVRNDLQAEVTRRQKVQEALELANHKLSEDSMRDSLTGLYNRRYLDQALLRSVAQAHRNRWLFSVMLIEIDHLKECVQRHGHAAGDALLRAASTHLRSAVREADTVCRYGDDTFVVLMPGTGPVAARDTAQRLRARVHLLELVLDGVALPALTLSIGVAPLTRSGQTVESLMKAADRALQRVKQAGRDQARLSSDYVTLDAMPE